MTERIRSGFHRSGLRERGKLVFVFAVCLNRDFPFLFVSPPMDEQISTTSLLCRKKTFPIPSFLSVPLKTDS